MEKALSKGPLLAQMLIECIRVIGVFCLLLLAVILFILNDSHEAICLLQIEEPYLPFWRRRVPIYLGSVSTVIFMVNINLICLYIYFVCAYLVLDEQQTQDFIAVCKNISMLCS